MNDITVTILESGNVRIDTGKFAGPVHATAEAAMLWIAKELGGDVDKVKNVHTHTHIHDHEHDHDHLHSHG
jgi:hypothetical protein